jgi:hypothetical protein
MTEIILLNIPVHMGNFFDQIYFLCNDIMYLKTYILAQPNKKSNFFSAYSGVKSLRPNCVIAGAGTAKHLQMLALKNDEHLFCM